jgi:FAD/FMN-containing dehydrogenase
MNSLNGAQVRAIRADLGRTIGADAILTDPDITAAYSLDATGRYGIPAAPIVLRPKRAQDVAAALKYCNDNAIPVIPQSGNTGLVAGSVPRTTHQVVLSTAALNFVNAQPGELTVGAGISNAELQSMARRQGMAYGIRIVQNARVGGMVATNAKGSRAYHNGDTASHVRNLQAATAEGALVDDFDGTGPDWLKLLVGSEGTLGVITAASLSLIPARAMRTVALLGLPSMTAAVQVITLLRDDFFVEAMEVMLGGGMDFVLRDLNLPDPPCGIAPVYLMVEAVGDSDPTELLGAALSELPDDIVLGDALADTDSKRHELWRYREAFPEACNRHQPIKLDVAVPLDQYAAFVNELPAAVAKADPDARAVLFGHGPVGNVHANFVGWTNEKAVTKATFDLVLQHGGTVAAEHGYGTAKAQWVRLEKSPEELEFLRTKKAILDPQGILNPGVIFV